MIGPRGYLNVWSSLRLSSYLENTAGLCRRILGGSERHRYTQFSGLIDSALAARWRMVRVLMETVAESGKRGSGVSQVVPDSAWGWRMSGLTRDGIAEPNSRKTKLSGTNGDRENPIFLVQLTTSRIGNHTRLMPNLLKVTTKNKIYPQKEKKCDFRGLLDSRGGVLSLVFAIGNTAGIARWNLTCELLLSL